MKRNALFPVMFYVLIVFLYTSTSIAQTTQITPLQGIFQDIQKLADISNSERFEALKTILSDIHFKFFNAKAQSHAEMQRKTVYN